MKTKQQADLAQQVQDTMAEITEFLAKSGSLVKDDEMPPQEGIEDQAAQEGADEMPAPEAAPAEDAGAEPHDEMAELAAHAQSLSDEDLDQMIQLLSQEKASRSAQAEPAPEMAPPAAPAPDMTAQKAMADDYAKMHKSMSVVLESLDKLTKEVEAIKTKPAAKVTVPKAVVTNAQQVMQKSAAAKPIQRLSKSETENFLMGRIRARDPNVSTKTMLDLNYVKSDSELASFQDDLAKTGVLFPKI